MKKTTHTRILAALLVLMAAVLAFSAATAGTSTEKQNRTYDGEQQLQKELNELPPFKFAKHKYGIGYGNCPVYTAPTEEAYRAANGKAVCSTNSAMDEAGYVSGWLLVRYETNKGNYRVGYIPPKYVRGFKSDMAPHFGYVPATADDVILVTDNPMVHGTSFAQLEKGEPFHILSRYNYYAKNGLDWWYIECEVDGQIAYGFIEYNEAMFHLGIDEEDSVG